MVLHKRQNECIIMQYQTVHEKRYFTTAMRCINIGRKMLMQVCLYTIMGRKVQKLSEISMSGKDERK